MVCCYYPRLRLVCLDFRGETRIAGVCRRFSILGMDTGCGFLCLVSVILPDFVLLFIGFCGCVHTGGGATCLDMGHPALGMSCYFVGLVSR